jgi:predicted phage tail protein
VTETSEPEPTISGTADAGVTITLTIDLGGGASVTYETTADVNGNWSIDLATATPVSGTFPADGLTPGEYPVTVTATDAVGNVSNVTSFTLTITNGTTNTGTTLYLPLIAR